jgi:hypothetical protein
MKFREFKLASVAAALMLSSGVSSAAVIGVGYFVANGDNNGSPTVSAEYVNGSGPLTSITAPFNTGVGFSNLDGVISGLSPITYGTSGVISLTPTGTLFADIGGYSYSWSSITKEYTSGGFSVFMRGTLSKGGLSEAYTAALSGTNGGGGPGVLPFSLSMEIRPTPKQVPLPGTMALLGVSFLAVAAVRATRRA